VIEITNELLVLTLLYFIPLFSDATSMQDLTMHFYFGWYFVTVVFVLILANFGFTVFNIVRLFSGGTSVIGDRIAKKMEDEGRLDLEKITGGNDLMRLMQHRRSMPGKITVTGRLAVDDALSQLDEVKTVRTNPINLIEQMKRRQQKENEMQMSQFTALEKRAKVKARELK
jgi:hypothetical protein